MVLTSIKIHSLKKCLFEDSKLKQETKKYKINVCFVKRFYVENVKSNKIPKFIHSCRSNNSVRSFVSEFRILESF